jgi:hypothetical protein
MDDDAEGLNDIEEAAHGDTRSNKRHAQEPDVDEVPTGLYYGRHQKKPRITQTVIRPKPAGVAPAAPSFEVPLDPQRRSSSTLIHIPPEPLPEIVVEKPRILTTSVPATSSPGLQGPAAQSASTVLDSQLHEKKSTSPNTDSGDMASMDITQTTPSISTATPFKAETKQEASGTAIEAEVRSSIPVRPATPKVKHEKPLGSTEKSCRHQ